MPSRYSAGPPGQQQAVPEAVAAGRHGRNPCCAAWGVQPALLFLIVGAAALHRSPRRLQVGLLGSARELQRDLERIADRADTDSPEGLHYILQGARPCLGRCPAAIHRRRAPHLAGSPGPWVRAGLSHSSPVLLLVRRP